MASYEIDQRGGHYDDLRAGAIASVVANAHRDMKARPEPFGPLDFIAWREVREAAKQEESEPILLDDPDAQTKLLFSVMFPK